jgi:deoxyribodipyrimidine photolyase-related protein
MKPEKFSQHSEDAKVIKKTKTMKKTLRLILGDQLNEQHSWYNEQDQNITYLLMEMRQETDYALHHIQKVAGFFASMRQFKEQLETNGHRIVYYKINSEDNQQDLEENVKSLIAQHQFECFEYQLPDEYRLDQQLKSLCDELAITTAAVDTEHFMTSRTEVAEFFTGKKQFIMENFYRMMRKKHDILMEEGKPEGGEWNYDGENRNAYKGAPTIPAAYSYHTDVSEVLSDIEASGCKTIGEIDPNNFHWPIQRSEALQFARYFCKEMLSHFGTYQDAMHTEEHYLFHSRISFALNTKMISPLEMVGYVLKYWEEDKENISIAQVEGYIRQIIGWREFMRGIYWAQMPDYQSKNFFGHERKLPKWYWTGETKMNCLKHSIKQSLDTAYAHHIQRLMITGNFALLNMTDPDAVDAWYLGIYIDAIEWVEITNTRGMSQFADGGIIGTKPYIASANYVNKMSNYCKSCHYSQSKKHGDKACPFNSLYWNFYQVHRDKLQKNQRISMMYRMWDKKDPEEQQKLLQQADFYLERMDDL